MRLALCLVALLAPACGGSEHPYKGRGPGPPSRQDTTRDVGANGEGELTMDEVEQNMREVRADVITCAQKTSYEGKVTVRVTIAPDGSASAVIEKGSGQAEVDDCVTGAFANAKFPTSRRGQRFQYGFTF